MTGRWRGGRKNVKMQLYFAPILRCFCDMIAKTAVARAPDAAINLALFVCAIEWEACHASFHARSPSTSHIPEGGVSEGDRESGGGRGQQGEVSGSDIWRATGDGPACMPLVNIEPLSAGNSTTMGSWTAPSEFVLRSANSSLAAYSPWSGVDSLPGNQESVLGKYVAITAMPCYQAVSFEELRVGDYVRTKSATTPGPASEHLRNAQSPQENLVFARPPPPLPAPAPTPQNSATPAASANVPASASTAGAPAGVSGAAAAGENTWFGATWFGAKGSDPATGPFGAATWGAFGAPATGRMMNAKQQQQPVALAVNCGTRLIVGRTAHCLKMLSEEEPIFEVALKANILKSQYMVA